MIKNKQKNILKTTKKDCKNEHETNIENYQMKKSILKEIKEEIDTGIYQETINKN